MPDDGDALGHLIAATTEWLVRAFPAPGGAHSRALARQQARQAVTVAAWLRYPTRIDAALIELLGPSGSGWLDPLPPAGDTIEPWRTWVDDVVAGWALALLRDRDLAVEACVTVGRCEHTGGLPLAFHRLTHPDRYDLDAAPLLRHPDLAGALAERHRTELDAALASA